MQIRQGISKSVSLHFILQMPDKTQETSHPLIAPLHVRRLKSVSPA